MSSTLSGNSLATEDISVSGDISFADNSKAVFGAGSDLQIYHDGTHSYIKDAGAGLLWIKGTSEVVIGGDTSNQIIARDGSDVELRYNSVKKLNTTSTGVDVTGNITADSADITGTIAADAANIAGAITSDGLTVDGGLISTADFTGTAAGTIRISGNGTTLGTSSFDLLQNSSGSFVLARNNETLHLGTSNVFDRLSIAGNGDISFYEDTGTTAKFFWDASAESLGIGTSSPDSPITVMEASNTAINVLKSTGSSLLKVGEDGSGNATYDATLSGGHIFKGTGTERMRIDSSGNLLVGKTSTSFAVEGTMIRAGGSAEFTKDGGAVINYNRLTSDGDISRFYEDSALVGSIGSVGGSSIYIEGKDYRSGLFFGDGNITPRYNHAGSDATQNLGASNARFKDLYLSGGVYLGGTGSANHLDDYEEGTWTPELTTSGGQTLTKDSSYTTGTYEKVGDLIHVHTYVKLSAIPASMSGRVRIGGLPFSASSGSYSHSSAANVHLTGLSSGYSSDGWIGWISFGANSVDVYYAANTNAVSSSNPSHTDALTSTTQIYLSVTYRTA
jgi:hypothetical protein